jgi:hypothetical protein
VGRPPGGRAGARGRQLPPGQVHAAAQPAAGAARPLTAPRSCMRLRCRKAPGAGRMNCGRERLLPRLGRWKWEGRGPRSGYRSADGPLAAGAFPLTDRPPSARTRAGPGRATLPRHNTGVSDELSPLQDLHTHSPRDGLILVPGGWPPLGVRGACGRCAVWPRCLWRARSDGMGRPLARGNACSLPLGGIGPGGRPVRLGAAASGGRPGPLPCACSWSGSRTVRSRP